MDTTVSDTPVRDQVIVGVRFMPVGKIYHFDATNFPHVQAGDWVIVTTSRGRQMGEIASLAPPRNGDADGPFKPIDRIAGNRDLAVRHYWAQKETEAMVIAREKVQELGLAIKVVRAEYALDGSRLSLLYTAEEDRPELGSFHSDVQRSFKAKVELRMIGPRDAAKIIGGSGACGLETRCCSMFLTEFSPISIKMAKEQGISLNPTEITGMCGRLRCCLIYEFEQYLAARKSLPRRGREVDTPFGKGKVVDLLPLKESAVVIVGDQRYEVHREDIQPLAELQALEQKAASPCGQGKGCNCGHTKKRRRKKKRKSDSGNGGEESGSAG